MSFVFKVCLKCLGELLSKLIRAYFQADNVADGGLCQGMYVPNFSLTMANMLSLAKHLTFLSYLLFLPGLIKQSIVIT